MTSQYKSHPLCKTYENMKSRCNNSSHPTFKYYGGRGIKISNRWLGKEGFNNFVEDMGERPKGMSIDRIDNDGDYEPNNCKWSTQSEQNKNQGLRIDNKSGIKGVYWRERDKRWYAHARRDKKYIYLGSHLTKEKAIKSRLKFEAGELKV